MDIEKKEINNIGGLVAESFENGFLGALNKIYFYGDLISKPFDLTVGKIFDKLDPEAMEKYKEYSEKQKKEVREQILENKRAINEYTSSKGPVTSLFLDLGSGLLEMASDPVTVTMNMAFGPFGFLVNACQNNIEYMVEKKTLYGENIDLTDRNDLINLASGIIFAKLGDIAEVKQKPLFEDAYKIPKNNTPALDRMVEGSANNPRPNNYGYVDMQNLGECANRELFGQTQSIPKGESGGEFIEKKIKDGVIPMLDKLNKEVSEQIYDKDITLKNDVSPRAVYEAFQGVGKEIELRRQQVTGELNEKFYNVLPTNRKYNGVDPFSEVQYRLTHEIDPASYVAMAQGKGSISDEYKAFADFLHESVNEFVSIKSGGDITQKEGFYLKTLYRQDKLQTDIVKAIDNRINPTDFIYGQLKNIGENHYVSKEWAKRLGLEKEGFYNLSETPELLKKLNYDLEDTTKKAIEFKMKGGSFTKGQGPQNLIDVGIEWGNLTPEQRQRYSALTKKIENARKEIRIKKYEVRGKQMKNIDLSDDDKKILKLSENIEEILTPKELIEYKDIRNSAYEKFATIFESYERRPEEINSLVFGEIINEQSGLNEFKKYFLPWEETNLKEMYGDTMTNSEKVLHRNLKGNLEKAVTKKVNEIIKTNQADINVSPKIWEDPDSMEGFTKRSNEVFKNYLAYRFLWGLNALGETFSNARLIKAGRRRLGFKENYSYLQAGYRHLRIYKNLVLHKRKILKEGLSVIADPMERREMELFLSKTLENRFIFNKGGKLKKALLKGQEMAGEQGGFFQLGSDTQRKAGAEYLSSKVMFKELPFKEWEDLDHSVINILKSNGIDEVKFKNVKSAIKEFGTYNEFLEFLYSGKRTIGVKNDVRTIFENFADNFGKEFDALDKGKIGKEDFMTRMQLLYKRYSMGIFNRTCNTLGTFYDSEGVLRYRFKKGGEFNLRNTFTGVSVSKALDIGTNFVIGGVLTEMTVSGIKWAHGWAFGTTADEIEEAKWKALLEGDFKPLLTDTLINSFFSSVGVDILFGAGTVIGGLIEGAKSVFKRNMSSNLKPEEKFLYGFLWGISNNKIASGIDNIKFQRNIPNRLTSSSRIANYYWKKDYKSKAEREQRIGDLPIETLVKKIFYSIKDPEEYLRKNPEKAYDILPDGMKDLPQDVAIVTASGIWEMTDDIMIKNYMMECMTEEDPKKREEYLKKMDLDYKTQMDKLDLEILKRFNYIMAYQGVDDPLYILTALYDLNNSKNKKDFLDDLLEENEKEDFKSFSKMLENNKSNMKEIFQRQREDNINGYIELINEIGDTVKKL